MAEITATLVKELRERTGQAMMDCKKALTESGGDVDKAVEILRKKGMAVLEKRGGRETKEGRVVGRISENGLRAVLVSLCSETDFTSKSDGFQNAAAFLADAMLAAETTPQSEEEIQKLSYNGRTVGEVVNEIVSTTGEKITLGECVRYERKDPGVLYSYVHFNNKLGTLVDIEVDREDAASHEKLQSLAADLAMHVTAVSPVAVSRDEVDPELVAREREIAAEQVKGKPAEIVEKIVVGKLGKWFQQIVLLEQPFVKDDKRTVADLTEEIGKEVGATVKVVRFARIQIG